MPPRASSSRKRAASPLPDPIADLTAQNAALQERYDALKAQYKANLDHSKKTDQRLERIEAALMARREGAAVAAPAPTSFNDGEVRRLREQNQMLLQSLMASNEAARKAEEELASVRAARQPELSEEAAAEALVRAKEKKRQADEKEERIRIAFQTFRGDKTYFIILPSTSVFKPAAAAWAKMNIERSRMRVFYEGMRCSELDTLKSLGVDDGAVFDLYEEQGGGWPSTLRCGESEV